MGKQVSFVADTASDTFVETTGDDTKMSVWVVDGSTLGGGTINILMRPSGFEGSAWGDLATGVAVGSRTVYEVGRDMDFGISVQGSTTPSITIIMGSVA